MATQSDFTVTTAPKEVIMTRTFDAPLELVFDAFTLKEHIEKWFGPHGFETTAESDPRPGGAFRIVMHATDALPPEFAGDYPMRGVYKEFVRPERIVWESSLVEHSEEWKAQLKAHCHTKSDDVFSAMATITFEDLGGKTKLTIRSTFASDAIRNGYVETGMNQGWSESLDRLDVLVQRTNR
ncbi:MAG: SRPBCC domain-containing protein [Bacteroidota bacterium]|nr:SRPBCC domain-containing protein [Bacteroidota bacterium]MDP4232089.1 SRPBCC domain-containing protein [Bacteroidota bacterium]MDP4241204.1 SRPBCC domain-containing protein [Bacteroidota bacterium]MDP4286596.1 SRPBCC domain-containing protein [Bacteroidota bacterium]